MDEDDVRRLGLTATDEFEVVQKIELRLSPIHVTEHRLRIYLTPDGKRTTGKCAGSERPDLRAANAGEPRLDEVGRALQLLDDRRHG